MSSLEQSLYDRLLSRSPEDNFIERKTQNVNAHELRKTLVTFANSLPEGETGVLFVGVHDKTGAILGVDATDKVQKRIFDAGDDCYPAIRPAMHVLGVEDKLVVAAVVSYSKRKPHFAGPAWVRSGSRSVKASEELYQDLLTSHCDKAGELLKWKGKQVTVRTVNKRLGNHHSDFEAGYDRETTATIVSVEPFTVTFSLDSFAHERCIEPLKRVELDWDPSLSRRRVIVRGAPT